MFLEKKKVLSQVSVMLSDDGHIFFLPVLVYVPLRPGLWERGVVFTQRFSTERRSTAFND